jgi:NADH-quinone oxidoreductase subunit G
VAGSASLATACARLLQESNHAGKPNNGLVGVWERANDQGAWEVGFTVEEDLAKALKGKAVYIVGADPVNDDPKLAKALEEAKFIAVQDVMETGTTEIADVVLPAQAFTEREGTFTSGERRVQRFYPAVPVTGEAKPDFAITAQIARHMGVILEGTSVSVVFNLLVETVQSFEGLDYAKLAQVKEQFPMVGRGDLYYGGTTYENRHGMGVHLSAAVTRGERVSIPRVQREAVPAPKEKELLAVPVNKLYHRGTTVMPAELLHERIGEATVSLHPQAAARLGVRAGQTVNVSFNGTSGQAVVRLDESISEEIALVPRSMGIPIREPVLAKVKP